MPTVLDKLTILADAAKYDASCSSSGGAKRDSLKGGLGSVTGAGICHSFTPDGRCVSLLKILLTNFCVYDCAYCINRRSSDVPRARFTVKEVVDLTMDFYKRNYIEGLFLSSGIIRSSDHTMEELIAVARTLRLERGFRGYIHLKTIPEASPELIDEAGRWADRLSINVELPTEEGLSTLAPEKTAASIRGAMARTRLAIDASDDLAATPSRAAKPRRYAPAGQSTQMIVGADAGTDDTILRTSASLYAGFNLKRVYYSAFSPIPASASILPSKAAPLKREHRLYQADWLIRHYGFEAGEVLEDAPGGMLDLDVDPKLAWALRHRELFPVDVNHAERELLLRVPGLGARTVDKVIAARRHKRLDLEDLRRMAGSLKRARAFVVAHNHTPGSLLDSAALPALVRPRAVQLPLFG